MDAVVEIEIRRNHGAVKSGQANFIEEMQLNAGQVTVGKERLGMACDQLEIEAIEQIIGAVSATKAHDGACVFIGEGCMQIGEPVLARSGKVERAAGLRRLANSGGKVENAQGIEAALNALRV